MVVLLALGGLVLVLTGCTNGRPSLWVSGKVVDQTTGRPIPGARVADDGYGDPPYRGATTDSVGCYGYQTWCEEHNVSARASGYRSQLKTLITDPFDRDTLETVNFALTPE